MAQRLIKEFIDDLEGGKAEETVRVASDHVEYEIDLSKQNPGLARGPGGIRG